MFVTLLVVFFPISRPGSPTHEAQEHTTKNMYVQLTMLYFCESGAMCFTAKSSNSPREAAAWTDSVSNIWWVDYLITGNYGGLGAQLFMVGALGCLGPPNLRFPKRSVGLCLNSRAQLFSPTSAEMGWTRNPGWRSFWCLRASAFGVVGALEIGSQLNIYEYLELA